MIYDNELAHFVSVLAPPNDKNKRLKWSNLADAYTRDFVKYDLAKTKV
jgi:hypothetical protein